MEFNQSSMKNIFSSLPSVFHGWFNTPRVLFWGYLYLQNMDRKTLGIPDTFDHQGTIFYHEYGQPKDSSNDKSRLEIVRDYFTKLGKLNHGEYYVRQVAKKMQDEWQYILREIKTIDWIDEHDERDVNWLWWRIMNTPFFQGHPALAVPPINSVEALKRINAALDLFTLETVPSRIFILETVPGQKSILAETSAKNEFSAKARKALQNQKNKAELKKNKKSINIYLSKEAKAKLDKITNEDKITQSDMIESLILNYQKKCM